MMDVRIAELAGRQHNRVARRQLRELGLSERAIAHRVARGRLAPIDQAVFAIAPVSEDDEWGRWMAATLTEPETFLSHASAASAFGTWTLERAFEVVTRCGSGGPRRLGNVLVHRSSTLAGDTTEWRGVPITSMPRTLLDLARSVSTPALARTLREAVRLKRTTLDELGEALGRYRGRRGSRRLAAVVARYAGLPLERARSGAEVRALEVLRAAGHVLPALNVRIAGEEADLSWAPERLIVEIDGGPFHLDRGEDLRKQEAWEAAGWRVRRIPSEDVYERPMRLRELAQRANVRQDPL
jgi:hypothetical protein